MIVRGVVVIASLVACSNPAKPGAGSGSATPAADPWSTTNAAPPAAPDPWQANADPAMPNQPAPSPRASPPEPAEPPHAQATTPSVPEPAARQPASETVPSGRYACQVLYVGANQMPTYMPSTLGTVEIDANGGYHALGFRGAEGTTAIQGDLLVFSGGSMNGWAATFGTTASGRYIHFSGTDFAHPTKSARRGDSMCYLR